MNAVCDDRGGRMMNAVREDRGGYTRNLGCINAA